MTIRNMLERQQLARRKFVDYIRWRTGMSQGEAEQVAALYLREKLVHLDPTCGQWRCAKHGAFLDPAPLRRALAKIQAPLTIEGRYRVVQQ